MKARLIIAIDGYSSCGKSTVAKALAKRLKLHYIDSGSMYRAVTLYFLQNNIPIPMPEELQDTRYNYERILEAVHITFRINSQTDFSEVYLNGANVEDQIRTMEISENVSHVSSIKAVRIKMVELQQKATDEGSLVMDGRDIGTTVFPQADLKIFMKADPLVRAKRRFDELTAKGMVVTMDEVIENIMSRDYEDTHREESPLRKAADAIILDNTHMNYDQQVEFVMNEIKKLKMADNFSK